MQPKNDGVPAFDDVLADLANYDQHAEWTHDDNFPLILEGDRVQWEVNEYSVTRCEGCYEQTCDFIHPHSVADVMNAMDAAAKALNDSLRVAERERGR